MKIFCIGRNYAEHAKELNNPIPEEPVIFMKPPTALLRDNQPFYIPEFTEEVHFEVELVLRISKNGRSVAPQFAGKYFDAIGLGIDFTARDIQSKCKAKGLPWEKAKAFDHSAVISEFLPMSQFDMEEGIGFQLFKNGTLVQDGRSTDMLFDFNSLIVHLSRYFTLQAGDYVYTGTPSGVGPVSIGDRLEGFLNGQKMFEFDVK